MPTALAAVRRLREAGIACRVLRFSILPLTAGAGPAGAGPLPLRRPAGGDRPGAAALRSAPLPLARPRRGSACRCSRRWPPRSRRSPRASRRPSSSTDGAVPLVGPATTRRSPRPPASCSPPAAPGGARASWASRPPPVPAEAVAPRLVEGIRWARERAPRRRCPIHGAPGRRGEPDVKLNADPCPLRQRYVERAALSPHRPRRPVPRRDAGGGARRLPAPRRDRLGVASTIRPRRSSATATPRRSSATSASFSGRHELAARPALPGGADRHRGADPRPLLRRRRAAPDRAAAASSRSTSTSTGTRC